MPSKNNNASVAYISLLASYRYKTKTLGFHFNMKEPAMQSNTVLAETDLQWNTHLDLSDDIDRAMVNATAE